MYNLFCSIIYTLFCKVKKKKNLLYFINEMLEIVHGSDVVIEHFKFHIRIYFSTKKKNSIALCHINH